MSAVRTFFQLPARRAVRRERSDDVPAAREGAAEAARARSTRPRSGACLNAPVGNEFVALRDRAALELLYSAGLRNAELVGLAVGDVDLREGLARVLGKGRRERLAVVGSHAVRAIEDYLPARAAKAKPTREGPALPEPPRDAAHEPLALPRCSSATSCAPTCRPARRRTRSGTRSRRTCSRAARRSARCRTCSATST